MKYLLFVFILLVSCSMPNAELSWLDFKLPDNNFKSIDNVLKYVIEDIEYKSEDKMYNFHSNYFQIPNETLKYKTGNCSAKSLLALAITYKKFSIKGSMLFISTENNGVIDHAIIKINGKKLETTGFNDKWVNNQVIKEIPFDLIQQEINIDND